jgi:hypothetical protein
MALHCINEVRQDRSQPLSADPIRSLLQHNQSLLYSLTVGASTAFDVHSNRTPFPVAYLFTWKANCLFAVVTARGNELVEIPCLALLRAVPVSPAQCSEQLLSCLHAESLLHVLPPVFGHILLRQRLYLGNKNTESRHPKLARTSRTCGVRLSS